MPPPPSTSTSTSPPRNSRWSVGIVELPTLADRQHQAADLSRVAGQLSASPQVAAEGFVAWLEKHDLAGQAWTVDEVWFLAANDYSPAAGIVLPKRNTFLRALKCCHSVSFRYDDRVRRGGKTVKTTVWCPPANVPQNSTL